MTRKTASSGRALLVTAGFLATVLVFGLTGAAGADSFTLTVVAQTNNTITFTYPQQTGYGYLYSANGVVVSRTNDPTRTQVKFSKTSSYEVAAIVKGTTGSYPPPAPPPPPPTGPAAPTNVNVTAVTQTGMTVTWSAVEGATNYRIYRGGVQIGQGPGSSGGFQDAWADSGLVCGTSYVYAVDAQNADGDSPKTSVTGTTLACSTPPPPSTITSAQCASRAAVAGAVLDAVTVTGGCNITATNVTVQNSTVNGTVTVRAAGFKLLNSHVDQFTLASRGDNALLEGNVFDGKNVHEQNFIWADDILHDGPTGWVIRNNTFTNYTSPSTTHSEALFIGGYAANGLIEGNYFYRNGNTGHIFFSWCAPNDCDGTGGTPRDPHDICVRGNTFDKTWQAYYQVVIRQETFAPNGHGIYTDDNIKIDMNPTQIAPGSQGVGGATDSNNYVQFMAGDNVQFQAEC